MADSFENYLKAQENLGRLHELRKGTAMDSVADRLAKAFKCDFVTRKEYDELFLAITRLTDRIEVQEDMQQHVYRLTDRVLKLEMAANPHGDMMSGSDMTDAVENPERK